jgi:hypothetical protein
VRSAHSEELLVDELIQHDLTGGRIGVPQAARLSQSEPQSWHFHVFAMDAL